MSSQREREREREREERERERELYVVGLFFICSVWIRNELMSAYLVKT